MATAMIWGAGGGIGRALTEALAAAGWDVIALSRHVNGLDSVAPHVIQADPVNEFEVQHAILASAQLTAEIDLWVYAAGDIHHAKLADQAAGDFAQTVDANLTGAFLTVRHSLPLLADDAHMIFIGARHERLHLPGFGAYAAAKAGLDAMAAVLAKEERRKRITVVRPAAVDTPFWEKVPLRLPKGASSAAETAAAILKLHASDTSGVVDL
ncbi:MAG: SDR family NAD(P)-dependent oxidoreductase [Caldilineaceae bacterium]|nr:SDR family NAD(P)-dependent oxidoreductase [Caldilineaceae bacterium]